MNMREIMRIVETAQSGLIIHNHMTGFHSGQMDGRLDAEVAGEIAGSLQYTIYQGEPSIRMIEITPGFQRRGIATALLRDLQARYPDEEIIWGMQTEDGAKLYAATEFVEVPNVEVAEEMERLAALRERRAEMMRQIEAMEGGDHTPERMAELSNLWNAVSDLEYEAEQLEYQLHDKRPVKRLIRLPGQDSRMTNSSHS